MKLLLLFIAVSFGLTAREARDVRNRCITLCAKSKGNKKGCETTCTEALTKQVMMQKKVATVPPRAAAAVKRSHPPPSVRANTKKQLHPPPPRRTVAAAATRAPQQLRRPGHLRRRQLRRP